MKRFCFFFASRDLYFMRMATKSIDEIQLAIICSSHAEASAVSARMTGGRAAHLGLFPGTIGLFSGIPAALIVSGGDEMQMHAAMLQASFLFDLKYALNFGTAVALREDLKAGDLAIIRECVRSYCPPALADNMLDDDSLIFPSDAIRDAILSAPSLQSSASMLNPAFKALNGHQQPHTLVQREILQVRLGSSDKPLCAHLGREYVRKRFGVDAQDSGSYGFFRAAQECGCPALSLKVITSSCGNDQGVDATKVLKTGAECLEVAINACQKAV